MKSPVPNPGELSRSQRSGDPACGVAAKRKSRFIGELKIEDSENIPIQFFATKCTKMIVKRLKIISEQWIANKNQCVVSRSPSTTCHICTPGTSNLAKT
jgi:hypothetical protein